jgi:hypothetical protein
MLQVFSKKDLKKLWEQDSSTITNIKFTNDGVRFTKTVTADNIKATLEMLGYKVNKVEIRSSGVLLDFEPKVGKNVMQFVQKK